MRIKIAPKIPKIEEPNKTNIEDITNPIPATSAFLNESHPNIIAKTEPIIETAPRPNVKYVVKLPTKITNALAAKAINPPIVATIASKPLYASFL